MVGQSKKGKKISGGRYTDIFLVLFSSGVTPSSTERLLPVLFLEVTSGGVRGTHAMLGIKPGLLQAEHVFSSLSWHSDKNINILKI